MAEKVSVYQIVTDRILDALKDGVVPWQRPWKDGGRHVNLKSKKAYRGINQLLLDLTAMSEGYTSPYWLSFKQAKEMGGQVRKGEKSTLITFWSMIDKDKSDPDSEKFRLLRYYRVFNVAQVDGLEDKIPSKSNDQAFDPIETAEAIWRGFENPPVLTHGGDRAAYAPSLDTIMMPDHKQFVNPESYYSTLFHEAAHSTGHATRLSREGITKLGAFGTDPYAKEELIAEITAAFLNAECGIIDSTIDNTTAYLDGWRRKLTADPKLIVQAAGQAQKASDHILGIKWDKEAS
jgi:antirestriction protein ArdC